MARPSRATGHRSVGLAVRQTIAAALVAISAVAMPTPAGAEEPKLPAARAAKPLPAPLVYLSDIDASIIQDMRYAGYDNFTGAPVAGYGAAECILTRRTAEALATLQRAFAAQRLSLKVYDCFRPLRAVAAFVQWTLASTADATTARFHPGLARNQLVSLGYIAARSGHSRGNVVDLTLVPIPRPGLPAFERGRIYGPCMASAEARAPDDSLDMGTSFDCFDVRSHARSGAVSATQAANRRALSEPLRRAGFVPYEREWWHFSFAAGDPGQAFDIDVEPRW